MKEHIYMSLSTNKMQYSNSVDLCTMYVSCPLKIDLSFGSPWYIVPLMSFLIWLQIHHHSLWDSVSNFSLCIVLKLFLLVFIFLFQIYVLINNTMNALIFVGMNFMGPRS
jgi:hypothetical protein